MISSLRALLCAALLLLAFFAAVSQNRQLPLRSGTLFISPNISSLPTDLDASFRFEDRYYFVLAFQNHPSNEQLLRMNNLGYELLDYLGTKTYLASAPVKSWQRDSLASLGAFYLGSLDPALKIANNLTAPAIPAHALSDSGKIKVAVSLLGNIEREKIVSVFQKAGADIATDDKAYESYVLLECPADKITAIAAIPFVAFVEAIHPPIEVFNYENRQDQRLTVLNASFGIERNLKGQNITIGVGDGGFVGSHIDFNKRLLNGTTTAIGSFGNHEDHVTGTVAGAGNKDPKNMGMAPRSRPITLQVTDILDNGPLFHSLYGMQLTNNSYGPAATTCSDFGIYDYESRETDRKHKALTGILHCFAAGNSGLTTPCTPYPSSYFSLLPSYQASKNVLTVGAVNDTDLICNFSSRGPSLDGRIKPEIMGVGESVTSTMPGDVYTTYNGTSMATPTVTASIALLTQRYKQLHAGAEPDMPLMKSLVITTADDLENVGPDFHTGFGRLNARRALLVLEDSAYRFGSVAQGDTAFFQFTVDTAIYQLKIGIHWRERESNPILSKMLLNDLDLQVERPSTVVEQAWVLDHTAANVALPALKGRDSMNNTELVTIDTADAGTYTIRVIGHDVAFGPQDFYLSYEKIPNYIELTYPYGGEAFKPGEVEKIRWDAFGYNSEGFTLEYSLDSGGSWTVISSTISANTRNYLWTVPSVVSGRALMRISRNSSPLSDVSNSHFTIINTPTSLATTNFCRGTVEVSWAAVSGAATYEVMMVDTFMKYYDTTTALKDTIFGLRQGGTYWITVRALTPERTAGRRAVAVSRTANSTTNCARPNDVGVYSLVTPIAYGRENTSTALSATQVVTVSIRNYGNTAVSNIPVNYSINNGTAINETYVPSLAAGATVNYSFTTTCNLSSPGTYQIRAWSSLSGDPMADNNDLDSVVTIKQLSNPAITLPFEEGFESSTHTVYNLAKTGIESNDRIDYAKSHANGRLMINNQASYVASGNAAATLCSYGTSTANSSKNDLLITTNLSSYIGQSVYLDFKFMNHGETGNYHDSVFVRGTDINSWVFVYDLYNNRPLAGSYKSVSAINISSLLSSAGQALSSSTQLKFSQHDPYAPSFNYQYGGYSFDDIRLYQANNDVAVDSILSPKSNCSLSSTENLSILISNHHSSALSNVPVYYRLNNGTILSELIPSIPANSTITHSFSTTLNLSAADAYDLDVWCDLSGDNYNDNDSLMNDTIYSLSTVSSYPYLQNFDAGKGLWYSSGDRSSWMWGAPEKVLTDRSADGKGWTTSLDGYYNDLELSYLNSPCFNLSSFSSDAILSFSGQYETEDGWDFYSVQYSEDGINWNTLGAMGDGLGYNWYNNAGNYFDSLKDLWSVMSHQIPLSSITDKTKVRFRFVMDADVSIFYEGIAIDDVHIHEAKDVYDSINVHNLSMPVSGSGWTSFIYGGKILAQINPNGQNLGMTNLSTYIDNGPVKYESDQYYLNRNWVIQPSNPPSSYVKVRLYFTDAEVNELRLASGCTGCSTIEDAYLASITKFSGDWSLEDSTLANDSPGVFSFKLPSTVDVIPYDNSYYAEFSTNSFSEFWLNGGGFNQDAPLLPVELLLFEAQKDGNDGLLYWITASEINSASFVIESAIASAENEKLQFEAIGELAAAGNSNELLTYHFSDRRPDKEGIYYYRLKMIDQNGDYQYSDIRALIFGNPQFPQAELFPNPFVSEFAILYYSLQEQSRLWTLYDAAGQILEQKNLIALKGMNQFHWQTVSLSSGMYYLKNEEGLVLKLMKY